VAAHILVVEDEEDIQELIAVNLGQAGHKVSRASDAEQANACMRGKLPDLVLLDWMLPGSTGIELARRWRADARSKDIPFIMLTARATEQEKLVAFESGADDYITKPFSIRELNARVKAVLRRRFPEKDEEVTSFAGLTLDPMSHRVRFGQLEIVLGATEFRLLNFFLTRPGRVFSRSQLIDQIWGRDTFIEERTVDVHIRRLRVALEIAGQKCLVQTVRGLGYRFDKI
jgi:two-component system, OmpR family, phosphate regulon response regulator PhoB